jgi:hypothetical protein
MATYTTEIMPYGLRAKVNFPPKLHHVLTKTNYSTGFHLA